MSQSAVQKFIADARALFAVESDPAKRWERMSPLLQELLADASIRAQSKSWPDCSQGSERAENLLFYEDPDYKFVINGLIKAPAHAHPDSRPRAQLDALRRARRDRIDRTLRACR